MGNRYTCKYTFEEWCINNDRQDILNRWDYEKNDKLPSQVAYRTKRKYYFKEDNLDESKLRSVISLTDTEDEGIFKNADSRREDLTGKEFGELIVLELDAERTKNTDNYNSYWLCKCSCGNIISVEASSLKMGQKTCSNSIHRLGENNPSWKGGVSSLRDRIRSSREYKKFRESVLEKDNHKCIICGSSVDLQVHHIYPFALFPDDRMRVEHAATLCADHHTIKSNSFHGLFGTRNNTPEQFEYYVNIKRPEYGNDEHFDVNKYMNSYDADDIEIDDYTLDLYE